MHVVATTLYANNVTAVDPALLLSRDYVPRQAVTTFLMLWIGGISLYFIFASISYYYFFVLNRHIYLPADKPQPKPGQVRREARQFWMSFGICNARPHPPR